MFNLCVFSESNTSSFGGWLGGMIMVFNASFNTSFGRTVVICNRDPLNNIEHLTFRLTVNTVDRLFIDNVCIWAGFFHLLIHFVYVLSLEIRISRGKGGNSINRHMFVHVPSQTLDF